MATQPVPVIEEILQAFEALKKALIDTSSIIYIQKAGYLDVLSQTIELNTIPEVISETNARITGIKLIPAPKSPVLSTDRKLITCALENKLAMISEDKGILTAMQKAGFGYYNALMVLNLMLYKKRIDDNRYRQYYGNLKTIARYSVDVWEFGNRIYAAVKSKKGKEKGWTSPEK